MSDLISREALLDFIEERSGNFGITVANKCNFKEIAKMVKTVDAVEVVHGHWDEWWPGDCALIMTGEEMLYECSECTAKFIEASNYCPNCGAKMDEVGE